MSNDRINRMRSLKELKGLIGQGSIEHPFETKLVQVAPAFTVSIEVIDRVTFNPCKFVTKGFFSDNHDLSLFFYKYEPTSDTTIGKTTPPIMRLLDLPSFMVDQLALRIAQIVGFITNRNVVVKNAALTVATYFTVAAYDRFLTTYVSSNDDENNSVSLAESLLLNSFYSVNKETKFPLELEGDDENVQADFWLHVVNATTELLADSPYDFAEGSVNMERTQITRDPRVHPEMHYEAQIRFRFDAKFQSELLRDSVFTTPLVISEGNFDFIELVVSYPEFNLTPIEGKQEGDFFMTVSETSNRLTARDESWDPEDSNVMETEDLESEDVIEEEDSEDIVEEIAEEAETSDDTEVEDEDEEEDPDLPLIDEKFVENSPEFKSDLEEKQTSETLVFREDEFVSEDKSKEDEYELDETVDQVARLTSELVDLREEQLVTSIIRLVGSISGFHVSNASDATAVIAENGVLRAMINDALAVAGITLSKSVFSLGDGPIQVGSRMVNFQGRDFYKLADLKVGMQRLIEMVISFKNAESETKQMARDLERASGQIATQNSELAELRGRVGELTKQLEEANRFRAIPSTAMQGVCVRFKVRFPKTGKSKVFYLTAENVSDDGKIKTKDYRRTENIHEALFFENRIDARDAIGHILKNEKHLDFAITKIKTAYLQSDNVEYVTMMERAV